MLKGDIEGAGILGRLKVLATDLFFREDHDLVVNTTAMDGGMARSPRARAFFDQGPEVSHFAYFGNPRTAERVVDGLLRADGADGGFVVPSEPVPLPPTIGVGRGTAKRPVVFVLPGITGSTLSGNFNGLVREIWVDLPQLAAGGLRHLAIDKPGIVAKEPLSLYYGALSRFLGATHEVHPWGFDWRRSILDTAKLFATALGSALAGTDQPVRIVAHSMGGLVARCALQDPKLWQRFKERPGSRLIQLGTPNGGSWSIPFMLMGRNELMGFLERIDFTMNRREQQDVIVRFQGALQMLPHGEPTLFDAARWQALSKFDPDDEGWATPSAADLAIAASFRDQFASAPADPERMFYVAGQAPTLIGIQQDRNAPPGQRIRFRIGAEGDGQVPWMTGIPPGIRAWYTDAEHGDLARHEPAFAAIQELLDQGTTRLLPDHPPVVSRGRGVPATKTRDPVPAFPDAEDLMLSGMGGKRRAPEAGRSPRIRIKVVHGHLAFATHPVLVGHYAGDTIAGAERALDVALDHRLSHRRKLGLYPGALGTSTVVLDRHRKPAGAIVVGLGDQADLAPGTLAETLRRGILAYAIEDQDDRRAAGDESPGGGRGCVGAVGRIGRRWSARARLCRRPAPRHARRPAAARRGRVRGARDPRTGGEPRHPGVAPARAGRGGQRVPQGLRARSLGQGDAWRPAERRRRERPDLVAADPDQHGPGRRRAGDALRDHHRSRPRRGVAGPRQHRLRRALRGPGHRQGGPHRPRRERRAGAVRAALAGADQGDQRRGPQSAPRARPRDGGLSVGAPGRSAAVDRDRPRRRRRAAQPGRGPRRAGAPARAEPVPRARRGAHRAAAGPGRGRSDGRAAARLPAVARSPDEADVVTEKLRARGLRGHPAVRRQGRGEQVVAALFEQAWSIVHIAAHGVVDFPVLGLDGKVRKETGIVLGGGLFLGPSILEQLPVVPSLVFVNCCHLATVDPAAEAAAQAQIGQRPALAASVAVQLIRMGVRGVVAAGWAVDDVAASRFAETFYDGMLGGASFGRAAMDARRLIYREGSQDLTWGAYQCYGEPDWRLVEDSRGGAAARDWSPASLAEAVAEAEEIAESAQVGLDRDPRSLRGRLDRLNKARRGQAFETDPRLYLALARAFGELGSLTKAVRYYEAALASEKGEGTLRALEQLQNLKVRQAVSGLGRDTDDAVLAERATVIRGAIERLDGLVDPDRRHDRAPKSTRRCLQAARDREPWCRPDNRTPADGGVLRRGPEDRQGGRRPDLLPLPDGPGRRDPPAAAGRHPGDRDARPPPAAVRGRASRRCQDRRFLDRRGDRRFAAVGGHQRWGHRRCGGGRRGRGLPRPLALRRLVAQAELGH